jgi:hypothetical protein
LTENRKNVAGVSLRSAWFPSSLASTVDDERFECFARADKVISMGSKTAEGGKEGQPWRQVREKVVREGEGFEVGEGLGEIEGEGCVRL